VIVCDIGLGALDPIRWCVPAGVCGSCGFTVCAEHGCLMCRLPADRAITASRKETP